MMIIPLQTDFYFSLFKAVYLVGMIANKFIREVNFV